MSKGGNDDKTMRSVFVGNIPYEATEEQLKEIFQQVGPVGSFRIVYDRETGKPKGYGFCEYQDLETAQSAMRNLNDFDFHGRTLRVGHAAGEQSNAEKVQAAQVVTGPPEEEIYGAKTDPEKAPEAISKAVASLPPEQMFELMKQMKLCIQNNPNEARNMLLQNPQLAYALLQAQIVMKIVDPQVALAMLHRQSEEIPPLIPSGGAASTAPPVNSAQSTPSVLPKQEPTGILPTPQQPGRHPMEVDMDPRGGAPPAARPGMGGSPMISGPSPGQGGPPPSRGGLLGDRPGESPFDNRMPPSSRSGDPYADRRDMGGRPEPDRFEGGTPGGDRYPPPQRSGPPPPSSRDMPPHGAPPPRGYEGGPSPRGGGPPYGGQHPGDRYGGPPHGGPAGPGAPGGMMGGRGDLRGGGPDPRSGPDPRGGDPRGSGGGGGGDPRDPRSQRMPPGGNMGGGPRQSGPPANAARPQPGGPRPGAPPPAPAAPAAAAVSPAQDQEKAALIMQVLQLTDEQIAMLPQEQRASILILKEQIARSTGGT